MANLNRCPPSQPGSWRFYLTISALSTDGWTGTGQIEWTTLDSVHQVELTTDGTTLHFVETEAIVPGKAQLGCVYDIAVAGGSGVWTCPDGSAGPFHFDADLP